MDQKPVKKWRIEPGLLKDQNGCYNNFLSKMLLNEVYLSKNNAYLNIFKEGRYVNNFHVCLRRIKNTPIWKDVLLFVISTFLNKLISFNFSDTCSIILINSKCLFQRMSES